MEIAIIWIGFALACAIVANNKGRSPVLWFLIGLCFSLIALIIILVLPSLKKEGAQLDARTQTRCPDCQEIILRGARVCKHCGSKAPGERIDRIAAHNASQRVQ